MAISKKQFGVLVGGAIDQMIIAGFVILFFWNTQASEIYHPPDALCAFATQS